VPLAIVFKSSDWGKTTDSRTLVGSNPSHNPVKRVSAILGPKKIKVYKQRLDEDVEWHTTLFVRLSCHSKLDNFLK
jgi:hypothetical protein